MSARPDLELPKSPVSVPWFEDIGQKAGLNVPHISAPEKRYVVESISGGLGMFDCDNDGRLDIVTVNGSTVDRYRRGGDPMVTLWRQRVNGTFEDVTQRAGLVRKGWGMGIAVADFDNDGNLDLYITGYGGNALYRNLGNCKFEDVTEKAGVIGGGFSTGAAWADYDRDGYVDLFVARYVHVDMDRLSVFGSTQFCQFKGVAVQCGPWGMQGESDLLFHNHGDGTFEEVSKKAGVNDHDENYGLGAVWGDYDNDGWPDLYVANDTGPNYLYRNKHDGTFEEQALWSGAALSSDGQGLGSMGVDWGDFDHDGRLDIFVTNFADQSNNLYRNLGRQGFGDVAWSAKLGQPSYQLVGWGTGFVDFDNDGWPDLFVVNGHVYPQVDTIAGSPGYKQPMQLFRNRGDRTFEDVSTAAGLSSMALASRRGAAFGDINNDGNVDVLTLNLGQPPSLLLNHVANANHRVIFKLVGTKSNRAAIGARVTIRAGAVTQFNEVRGGGSYLSQNDLRLHFGLGESQNMETAAVRWPSGLTEIFKNIESDVIYILIEGQGIKSRLRLPTTFCRTGIRCHLDTP